MEKTCSRCGKTYPLEAFSITRQNKDGRAGQCKPCRAEIRRNTWRDNPEVRARETAQRKARLAAGIRFPSQKLSDRKPFTAEQRAAGAERQRFNARIWAARGKADRLAVPINDLTVDDWYAILDTYGRVCSYCGSECEPWIDHVVPIAKGGSNTRANVVPSCESCNRRKAQRSAEEFRANLCANGHVQAGDNLYTYPSGRTACRACVRVAQEKYKAKRSTQ